MSTIITSRLLTKTTAKILTILAALLLILSGCSSTDATAFMAASSTTTSTSATSSTSTAGGDDDGTVGITDNDGTVKQLPFYTGDSTNVLVVNSTEDANTPALLDYYERWNANTLTWADLLERISAQPGTSSEGYEEGINAYASLTNFDMDDIEKFASVNYSDDDGNVVGVNALAIQAYNVGDMSNEEIISLLKEKYVTDDIEDAIGLPIEELPIQRINNGFVNTRNEGTDDNLVMGTFFDTEVMIRISLMPIIFDDDGNPVKLDGSLGAGVFIDCGNLHWVPQEVWTCESDNSCERPNTTTPTTTPTTTTPTTTTPTTTTPTTTTPTTTTPTTTAPKDWSKLPSTPDGVTKLGAGELTNNSGQTSTNSGSGTSGNVGSSTVPSGTGSDDTAPDISKDDASIVAPSATPGGDDTSDDTSDSDITNQDDGGVNGDTVIVNPDGDNNDDS